MFSKKRKEVEGIMAPLKRQKKEDFLITERDKENFCRICALRTYIVGIQYYAGKNSVSNGSKIWLRRNPGNTVDSNAIECWPKPTSCTPQQIVGHICKELAVPLSRLLDNNLVSVEGTIVTDVEALSVADYVIPILITLSGNITRKEELISELQLYQFYNFISHNRTAPMKIRRVEGRLMYMAYEIEEVDSEEKEEFDLEHMDLRHLLVLFALLLEENNQFCLESCDWGKKLNRVNVDFKLPEEPDDILRKRINSKQLKNYVVVRDQKVAFKSTQVLGIVVQFISVEKSYVDYFIQHASIQGLHEYCVTSSQIVSKPVFVLNGDQLRKLVERMKYDIFSSPVITHKSIHKIVSETLKIPRVILRWNEEGRRSFVKSIQEGTEVIFHARWMILGCAGVGKTTLLKKIRGLSMEEVCNTVPTEGVEIHNRIFEVTGNSLQDVHDENISPVGVTLDQSIGKPKNKMHQSTSSSKPNQTSKPTSKPNHAIDARQTSLQKASGRENTRTKLDVPKTRVEAVPHSFHKKEIPVSISSVSEVDSDPLPKILPFLTNKIKHANSNTVDILDFAGESDYYASHQIFLRPQAGYILVLNMAESLDDVPSKTIANSMMFNEWTNTDFLWYWMSSIHKNSPSAPVVLVATHAEGKTKREVEEYFVEVWDKIRNKKLKGHLNEERKFTVALNDDRNIAELKECLAKQSETLATWGQKIPRKWALCEKFLEDLKKSLKIISLRDISSLLEATLEDLQISCKDFIWVLKFFHDIGNIIHFSEKGLKEFVVLDVDSFIELFKCIIKTDVESRGKIARQFGNKWGRYIENGLLNEKMCLEMLKGVHSLKDGDKHILFQYMAHIGLMVNITDSTLVEKIWYVPSMNKSSFPSRKFENYKMSSIYCFNADFLPDILYHRLVSNVIAGHSLGEIVSDGHRKCIYQNVCALYHHEDTHIVLIGRCETSIQIQVLSMIDLDKTVSRDILKKVSKEVKDLKNIFHLNTEFSEGLLCDRSSITDQFILSGISKKYLLKVCETNDTFLCKKCAVGQPHMVNSKDLLSYWIDVDDIMKDDVMKKKRKIYIKFYMVAVKIKKQFDARQLCFKLFEDDSLMESDGIQNLERDLFEGLVKWMELYPDIPHIKTLAELLQDIGRRDIAENIKHTKYTDFESYPVTSPQLCIKMKDIETVVEETAAAYHRLGIFLGLSPQQLRHIEVDHPKSVRTKMQHVLKFRTVSRQELVNSLHFVGRVDVIKTLTTSWNKT